MNIWAAATAIVGVSVAAFVAVFMKMAYKEVRDVRKGRPIQLPLIDKTHTHEHEDKPVPARV